MTEHSADTVERVYLIRKYGGYYRPNSQGYTDSALTAGRYTKAEAESISHPNGPNGPRDGMSYIHEDDVKCENLAFHRAALSTLTVEEAAKVKKTAIQWLKLIRDQDQGCGGRLNPQEIYQAMKREAANAITAIADTPKEE